MIIALTVTAASYCWDLHHHNIIFFWNSYYWSSAWESILARDGEANNLLYHIQDHIDDVNKQDALGCSPLIYASWGGFMTLVCILINVGCDLNIQNRWGASALHLAAENGRLDIVKVLVEAGADTTLRNEDGLCPSDVAKNQDIVDYLCSGLI